MEDFFTDKKSFTVRTHNEHFIQVDRDSHGSLNIWIRDWLGKPVMDFYINPTQAAGLTEVFRGIPDKSIEASAIRLFRAQHEGSDECLVNSSGVCVHCRTYYRDRDTNWIHCEHCQKRIPETESMQLSVRHQHHFFCSSGCRNAWFIQETLPCKLCGIRILREDASGDYFCCPEHWDLWVNNR